MDGKWQLSFSPTLAFAFMNVYCKYTDTELASQIKEGDAAAFTEAYNRYWEQLLALGYYYTHHKQAAEDIVHDVFTSLWTRRAEMPIQSLKAYLATAVKFAVFKAIAREKRRRELQQDLSIPEQSSEIEKQLDARFLHDYLQGVVEQLPDKARLVFTYSRSAELSVNEIATKMDLSPKAVEYHITKARRTLKEALKLIKCLFV